MSIVDEVDMLSGLQACNYSAMGALAFTVYDMILSLDQEVEKIWRRPWTNLKFLFFVFRTLSLGAQIYSAAATMRLTAGASSTLRGCQILVGFQGASSQVLMMAAQVILLLRVQALYYEKKYLRWLLRFLFLTEIAIMWTVFCLSMPQIRYGTHCVTIYFPTIAIGFFVPPVLFELLLFILTMVKFYQAVRDGWGREPVIARFLRDGIWAFALPFTILVLNTCCMILLPGSRSSVLYSWLLAIPGFCGCHLILNLSHLLKCSPTTSFTEDVVIDTVVPTLGTAMTDFHFNSYQLDDTLPGPSFLSPQRHVAWGNAL